MRQDGGRGRGITHVAGHAKAASEGGVETWGHPQVALALVLTYGGPQAPDTFTYEKRKKRVILIRWVDGKMAALHSIGAMFLAG